MAMPFARLLAMLTFGVATTITVVLVRLRLYSVIFLVSAAAIAAALFLVLSRGGNIGSAAQSTPSPVGSRKRLLSLSTTLFFLFTAGSLLAIRTVTYDKPIAYFALVAASAGALALRIVLLESPKGVPGSLVLVLILAANLFGSDQLVFPLGLGGADASVHLHFLVEPIVMTGFIPATDPCGLVYGSFPGHHLLVATTSILIAAPPERTYYSLGPILMLLPVAVTFLIARSLFGGRTALLAALLLSGSSYYVFWASHAATLTYAVPLIALLVFTLVKSFAGRNARILLASALLALALVMTHPYSTAIFGVILIGLVVGQFVARKRAGPWPWGTRITGVAFGYTLLIYWTNFSCLVTKSLHLAQGYVNAFFGEATITAPAVYDRLPLQTIFVNTVGDALLQFLVVLGFLFILSRGLSARTMAILGPAITLLLISGVGLVTPLTYLAPNRIYVFLQFLGFAPLAAFAVRELGVPRASSKQARRRAIRIGLAAFLAALFVFASTASTIAGFETSPLVGNQPFVKLYETPSEESSAGWLCSHIASPTLINMSRSIFGLDRHEVRDCVTPLTPLAPGKDALNYLPAPHKGEVNASLLPFGSLVWFSRYDENPGFQAGESGPATGVGQGVILRLNPDADASFTTFDRLYDNGAVQVYLVNG